VILEWGCLGSIIHNILLFSIFPPAYLCIFVNWVGSTMKIDRSYDTCFKIFKIACLGRGGGLCWGCVWVLILDKKSVRPGSWGITYIYGLAFLCSIFNFNECQCPRWKRHKRLEQCAPILHLYKLTIDLIKIDIYEGRFNYNGLKY
jgi:hypothetical protein